MGCPDPGVPTVIAPGPGAKMNTDAAVFVPRSREVGGGAVGHDRLFG